MFAVCISLGSTSAYVSVAPVPSQQDGGSAPAAAAPIKVVANSAGHRNTPVAAAFADQEMLFGENALHTFARQPQKVVPYLFAFSAAAAATNDAAQGGKDAERQLAENFLSVVEQGVRGKYRGYCAMETREPGEGIVRHGFASEVDGPDGEPVEKFMSAEDLFIQFLNYVKEHSIDAACGLTASGDADDAAKSPSKKTAKNIMLTIVAPRSAFPGVAVGTAARADATEWLADAVRGSQLDAVAAQTAILFSDEAALLAFDSAPRVGAASDKPYFLLPPSAVGGSAVRPVTEGVVLVVDWGAQALNLTLQQTSGGVLLQPSAGVPYMACASGADSETERYYCGSIRCNSGDAIDVMLAEKVAANYIVTNRRLFQGQIPNLRPLQDYISSGAAAPAAASEARRIVTETIPARAMRRLRLLMGDKKIALNTNPQAMSVSVEMEAFYEGMDLMDSQSLSRNKFEAAMISEWNCVERFEDALGEFVRRHRATLEAKKITHVLLTGGMCQLPSVTQGVRRVMQSPKNADVLFALGTANGAVSVVDASFVGNGVAADELFCVGGCLHSFHLARVVAEREGVAKRLTKANKKKRGGKATAAEALRERQSALKSVWEALTEPVSDHEDMDGDNELSGADNGGLAAAEVAGRSYVLGRAVYLYTGDADSLAAAAAKATGEGGRLTLPREQLVPLFPAGSAIPQRQVCGMGEGDGDVAVYLFAAADQDAAGGEAAVVHPLGAGGLKVPRDATEDSFGFVVFTLRTDVDDDGRRGVKIAVQRVVSRADAMPESLTPGNTTDVADITLM